MVDTSQVIKLMQNFELSRQHKKVFLTKKCIKWLEILETLPLDSTRDLVAILLYFGRISKAFANHDIPVLANILNIVICKGF